MAKSPAMENHTHHLSHWMQTYLIDLASGIPEEKFWQGHRFINSPGWTMMHVIVEGELAIAKLAPDYQLVAGDPGDFASGSSGKARSDLGFSQITTLFQSVYHELESLVDTHFIDLQRMPINDEQLKNVLHNELDFNLHLLTTHLASHCDALNKWRRAMGIKLPYE